MMSFAVTPYLRQCFMGVLLTSWLGCASQLEAQPAITSVIPADGATNIATIAQVIFTFNTAMSSYTDVYFTGSYGWPVSVTSSWSAGNTMLTCTPTPPFPTGTVIHWSVNNGFDTNFIPLTGATSGSFTTSGPGVVTDHTPNAYTSFVVEKTYLYAQTSDAAPTTDTNYPYSLLASTSLASNRTETSITVTLPTGIVSNLTQNPLAYFDYDCFGYTTNQATFELAFAQGTYTFTIEAATSNQTFAVVLPTDMPQPNAPHLTNYTAAQAIDATKDFTIGWDAFVGGAGSSNLVFFSIDTSGGNVFATGDLGTTNALDGTAQSVTIPANTLYPGSSYSGSVLFYHSLIISNDAANMSAVFRGSTTFFTVVTVPAAIEPLTFSKARLSNGTMSFDISCGAGQLFTILSAGDLSLPPAQWTALLTTNSPGTNVHFVDTRPVSGTARFYRARNGY
jgi:hypothetical protein